MNIILFLHKTTSNAQNIHPGVITCCVCIFYILTLLFDFLALKFENN